MVQQQPAPPLLVMSLTKRLVAVNAHTGQRVWEFETGGDYDGRLFVEQGLVLYTMSRGVLLCLEYLTGALRWKAQLPGNIGMGGRVIVFAGCVIACGMGEAACVNVQTGMLIWHDPFKGYGNLSGAMAAPGVDAQIDRH